MCFLNFSIVSAFMKVFVIKVTQKDEILYSTREKHYSQVNVVNTWMSPG